MDILINGAGGRMGRVVTALLEEKGHRGIPVDPHVRGEGILPALWVCEGSPHCVIDFSTHEGTAPLLDWAIAKKCPVVVGTTGHTEGELSVIRAAAEQIPLFLAANLSLGVAVLTGLARTAAALLPEGDLEIIETHHSGKTDVPSGTALLLADALRHQRPDAVPLVGRHKNGRRSPREIGIHSIRAGSSSGIHTVLLDCGAQLLTLTHEARDPVIYGEGALAAAVFLMGKAPGLYTMDDLLRERGVL